MVVPSLLSERGPKANCKLMLLLIWSVATPYGIDKRSSPLSTGLRSDTSRQKNLSMMNLCIQNIIGEKGYEMLKSDSVLGSCKSRHAAIAGTLPACLRTPAPLSVTGS